MSTTIAQQITNTIPVEMAILPDGKVRLYCINRGRLFRFMNKYLPNHKPCEYKFFRTGTAAIFPELPNETIVELTLVTQSSNWERLAKKTEAVTQHLFTDKGKPRKMTQVFKMVKKQFSQIDEEIDQKIAERKAEKELQSQDK